MAFARRIAGPLGGRRRAVIEVPSSSLADLMSSAQALAEWHSLAAHHQPNQVLMDRLAQQLGGRVERLHSLDAVEPAPQAQRVKARSLRLSGVKKLAEQVLLKYQDPVPVARAELEFRRTLCSPEPSHLTSHPSHHPQGGRQPAKPPVAPAAAPTPVLAAGVKAGMSSVLGLRTLLQQHRLRLGWAWPDLQQVAREACERAHKEQAIVAAHAEAKAVGDCQAMSALLQQLLQLEGLSSLEQYQQLLQQAKDTEAATSGSTAGGGLAWVRLRHAGSRGAGQGSAAGVGVAHSGVSAQLEQLQGQAGLAHVLMATPMSGSEGLQAPQASPASPSPPDIPTPSCQCHSSIQVVTGASAASQAQLIAHQAPGSIWLSSSSQLDAGSTSASLPAARCSCPHPSAPPLPPAPQPTQPTWPEPTATGIPLPDFSPTPTSPCLTIPPTSQLDFSPASPSSFQLDFSPATPSSSSSQLDPPTTAPSSSSPSSHPALATALTTTTTQDSRLQHSTLTLQAPRPASVPPPALRPWATSPTPCAHACHLPHQVGCPSPDKEAQGEGDGQGLTFQLSAPFSALTPRLGSAACDRNRKGPAPDPLASQGSGSTSQPWHGWDVSASTPSAQGCDSVITGQRPASASGRPGSCGTLNPAHPTHIRPPTSNPSPSPSLLPTHSSTHSPSPLLLSHPTSTGHRLISPSCSRPGHQKQRPLSAVEAASGGSEGPWLTPPGTDHTASSRTQCIRSSRSRLQAASSTPSSLSQTSCLDGPARAHRQGTGSLGHTWSPKAHWGRPRSVSPLASVCTAWELNPGGGAGEVRTGTGSMVSPHDVLRDVLPDSTTGSGAQSPHCPPSPVSAQCNPIRRIPPGSPDPDAPPCSQQRPAGTDCLDDTFGSLARPASSQLMAPSQRPAGPFRSGSTPPSTSRSGAGNGVGQPSEQRPAYLRLYPPAEELERAARTAYCRRAHHPPYAALQSGKGGLRSDPP